MLFLHSLLDASHMRFRLAARLAFKHRRFISPVGALLLVVLALVRCPLWMVGLVRCKAFASAEHFSAMTGLSQRCLWQSKEPVPSLSWVSLRAHTRLPLICGKPRSGLISLVGLTIL